MPANSFIIQVRVKPNAGVSALEQKGDGTWLAQLKASPVDGKANEELIALVAKQFACSRSSISVKSGVRRRTKLIKIESR
jgi:uncharacterized protein YggU (UPF0235/DUF167 family)